MVLGSHFIYFLFQFSVHAFSLLIYSKLSLTIPLRLVSAHDSFSCHQGAPASLVSPPPQRERPRSSHPWAPPPGPLPPRSMRGAGSHTPGWWASPPGNRVMLLLVVVGRQWLVVEVSLVGLGVVGLVGGRTQAPAPSPSPVPATPPWPMALPRTDPTTTSTSTRWVEAPRALWGRRPRLGCVSHGWFSCMSVVMAIHGASIPL